MIYTFFVNSVENSARNHIEFFSMTNWLPLYWNREKV